MLTAMVSRTIATSRAAWPRSEGDMMTPEDPSTLTLALIGVGTLAAYAAFRRSRQPRHEITADRHLADVQPAQASLQQIATERVAGDEPSRAA